MRDSTGEPEHLLVQVEDLTEHHRALRELEYRAFHDPLTGLRNRTWVQEILEVDLVAARLASSSLSVPASSCLRECHDVKCGHHTRIARTGQSA